MVGRVSVTRTSWWMSIGGNFRVSSVLHQMRLLASESHDPNFLLLAFAFSLVFGPSAWNKLPLSLHQAPTLSMFKSNIKTHIFFTSVGLSSLLFVFLCPRPFRDCWLVIVSVISECPRIAASECALNYHITSLIIMIVSGALYETYHSDTLSEHCVRYPV